MGVNDLILFLMLVLDTQLTRVSEHWINKNERLISFTIGTTDLSYTVQRNKHIDGNVPVLVGRNQEITDWAAQTKQQVRNKYRNRLTNRFNYCRKAQCNEPSQHAINSLLIPSGLFSKSVTLY